MLHILAIETSCDDTCISIIKIKKSKLNSSDLNPFRDTEVLVNIVSSQTKLHEKYGGVYPLLAKREHEKNLPIIFKQALQQAQNPKLDLIAVTVGPGLEPCLWVGLNFAQALAQKLNLPLIPVNHIEAHILVNLLTQDNYTELLPAIGLIISGGHTQLVLMQNINRYKLLGETRDDAAGECFDKTARVLGLPYPGGPSIAKAAAEPSIFKVTLPRPMLHSKNYDFSFSGLKTAVLYDYQSRSPKVRKSKSYIQGMAKEIQQAIIDVLIKKTTKAVQDYQAKSIILGGGVSANISLRQQFKQRSQELKVKLLVPDRSLSTDNALMIAFTAYLKQKDKTKAWQKVKVHANLRICNH